jgi:hypothetical protein
MSWRGSWQLLSALLSASLLLGAASAAHAADRHVGYYYPQPMSREVYEPRAATLADASRKGRIVFVTELTNQMMNNPYPSPFAVFAKGSDAQKMIITSLYADGYNTLFRMRGLLALPSARARSTAIFAQYQVEYLFTFLDLLKLFGFEQLAVTDGDQFAHQILLQ